MISLEQDRAGRLFLLRKSAAGRAGEFDIFVDDLAVVNHFHHFRILGLFAVGIEARRAEGDVESLPLACQLAGVDARRVAFDILLDRKSTRLNSSHERLSRMPSSA